MVYWPGSYDFACPFDLVSGTFFSSLVCPENLYIYFIKRAQSLSHLAGLFIRFVMMELDTYQEIRGLTKLSLA